MVRTTVPEVLFSLEESHDAPMYCDSAVPKVTAKSPWPAATIGSALLEKVRIVDAVVESFWHRKNVRDISPTDTVIVPAVVADEVFSATPASITVTAVNTTAAIVVPP
jgi:hypothetical protein